MEKFAPNDMVAHLDEGRKEIFWRFDMRRSCPCEEKAERKMNDIEAQVQSRFSA
jgi:hypothetical protein